MNDAVFNHLSAIRSSRQYLFGWPANMRRYHREFHRLQTLAGLPRSEHFGLHSLRRTAATRLWQSNPAAAQLMLGHTSMLTTIRHYVQSEGIIAQAIKDMPQPASFVLAPEAPPQLTPG
jgi:integrase